MLTPEMTPEDKLHHFAMLFAFKARSPNASRTTMYAYERALVEVLFAVRQEMIETLQALGEVSAAELLSKLADSEYAQTHDDARYAVLGALYERAAPYGYLLDPARVDTSKLDDPEDLANWPPKASWVGHYMRTRSAGPPFLNRDEMIKRGRVVAQVVDEHRQREASRKIAPRIKG